MGGARPDPDAARAARHGGGLARPELRDRRTRAGRAARGHRARPAADLTASVYHATHPEPLPVDTLLRAVAECTGADWPDRELTVDRARAVLAEHGVPPSGLDMFTTDHVFDSTPLWSDLRRAPGAGFDTDFPSRRLGTARPCGTVDRGRARELDGQVFDRPSDQLAKWTLLNAFRRRPGTPPSALVRPSKIFYGMAHSFSFRTRRIRPPGPAI